MHRTIGAFEVNPKEFKYLSNEACWLGWEVL